MLLNISGTKALIIQSESEINVYVQNINYIAQMRCLNYIRQCILDIHKELEIPPNSSQELMVMRANDEEMLAYKIKVWEEKPMERNRNITITGETVNIGDIFGDNNVRMGDSYGDNSKSQLLDSIFNDIITELDSMQESDKKDRELLLQILEAMQNMNNKPTKANKIRLRELLSKGTAVILTLLGTSADILALLDHFKITLPGI